MSADHQPSVPGEPGFEQLEAQGWTDLHLHPTDSEWSPELSQVPEIIRALGGDHLGLLTLHTVEDLWDDESAVPEPLLEQEGVSLAELPALLQRADVRHLTAVVDPAATGFLPLMAQCQSRDWHACILSLGWGLTTVPDPECKRTAARFRFSVAVGGPGVPTNYRAFARNIAESDAVRAACERLQGILGRDCTATPAFGE